MGGRGGGRHIFTVSTNQPDQEGRQRNRNVSLSPSLPPYPLSLSLSYTPRRQKFPSGYLAGGKERKGESHSRPPGQKNPQGLQVKLLERGVRRGRVSDCNKLSQSSLSLPSSGDWGGIKKEGMRCVQREREPPSSGTGPEPSVLQAAPF